MDLTVANYKKQGGSGGGGGGVSEVREYRKGNWTVEEAMVLIEAKKMDEERRMKRASHGGERGKPAELRWKWVEDYCWRRGCFRSQNQCNDKWDNLMRDFKKVREYEGGRAAAADSSYWRIEKNERREKNLPSNFSPEIYEALVELTERKSTQRFAASVLGEPSMPPHHHPLQQPPLTQTAPPPTHPPPTERPALAFSQAPLPT
ncbi:Homeodomain-like superfamily protein, partial [Perilla frutescens var. hirtella]